jgi:methylmalonyl-CoA/ethylmalonyl-CoA epimerase
MPSLDVLSTLCCWSKHAMSSQTWGRYVCSMIDPAMSGPTRLVYAVDDVREAAAGWAPVGIGPFFIVDHIELLDVRVNGEEATFDHSRASGWWGDVMFELICQHDLRADAAPIVGTSGLHHVAHSVNNFEATSAGLATDGHAEVLSARTTAGGGGGFALHDGGSARGHLIGIYEATPALRDFSDMVRGASIGWDGSDPVRSL